MATNKPETFDRWMAEIERRLHVLETAPRAGHTSIGSGGLRVRDGGAILSDDFDGDGLEEPGTHGWWLGREGIVVNRAVIRTGQQVVIASDEIETSPVLPTLTESTQTFASVAVPVPDWATSALVIATATMSCSITSFGEGSGNAMFCRARVAGVDSESARQSLSGTASAILPHGSVTAVLGRTIESPGETITCQLRGEGTSDTPTIVVAGAITALVMFSD